MDSKDSKTLKKLRNQIDRVDRRLRKLLDQRAALAVKIGRFKKAHGLPVFDGQREGQILNRLTRAKGPMPTADLRKIFHEILSASRKLQSR